MASALSYNSMNLSATVFSRTNLPIPITRDFPVEISPYVPCNYNLRSRARTGQKRSSTEVSATVATRENNTVSSKSSDQKKLRVLVAGGGIGGLVFALAAKKKGFEVMVFERDLSAVRGEGQYRGPIQIQSNALAALEAIDMDVAEEVMRVGCITGDRINGLVDGVSGTWYVKFDTFTPAAERGLPVTRVISRMLLQQILAGAVGDEIIFNGSNVVDFQDLGNKVRKNLFGLEEAVYSDYTCYTGITDFVPADISSVGYRVFLGHKQYFVSSDVGAGKMQWYAFHKEPAGGADAPNGKKERLLKIFGGWCDNVVDLLLATEEDAILRRDIYDRTPTLTWGKGNVTLLGDSVHAMQPNLGQGGCMAIEDGYQLALELEKALKKSHELGTPPDIAASLRSYETSRKLRVAIIHGMARMAAIMASTYKAYLGVGLGPLSFLTKFRIPHPGRVGGRIFIDKAMPLMLSWVLGGNSSKLEGRPPSCRLSDKADDQLRSWFEDDDALERAIDGEWYLIPCGQENGASQLIRLNRDEKITCIIGNTSNGDSSRITVPLPQVSENHACITYKDGGFYVSDLGSKHGTWLADIEEKRYRVPPNFAVRFHPSDVIEIGPGQKVAFRVKVMQATPRSPEKDGILQAA